MSWYRDAVIYEVHVRAFFDSNGDGIGDFAGLRQKLDYICSLGVDTLWVLPFYPSPLRDDGYDVADYDGVHPSFGTITDFEQFVDEAHARGLRVITELVLNHTSDQHAWFQRARQAPSGSAERDWYVWSDTDDRYPEVRIIFETYEDSNWTWDPVAQQYYWHRFFHHQPDLNFDNPEVCAAVFEVFDRWADKGVDGFRLDAIPYLFEREGTLCESLPETHAFIRELRAHLEQTHPDLMLLAEANQPIEQTAAYFGAADECHMCFHFPLMTRLYLGLALGKAAPIVDVIERTADLPPSCAWATFLRNHDELTLEMVSEEERAVMLQMYATDDRATISQGIRRRLAPLLGNDLRKIKLLNAILFGLPGAPVIYYGDEIGMGDDLDLPDRFGVRTPMQWSSDEGAGFSTSATTYLPFVSDPDYAPEVVNVADQANDPDSLLNWTRRLIATRRRHRGFARGDVRCIDLGNPALLAFERRDDGERLLVLANLSGEVVNVDVADEWALLLGKAAGELGPWGFAWFRERDSPA